MPIVPKWKHICSKNMKISISQSNIYVGFYIAGLTRAFNELICMVAPIVYYISQSYSKKTLFVTRPPEYNPCGTQFGKHSITEMSRAIVSLLKFKILQKGQYIAHLLIIISALEKNGQVREPTSYLGHGYRME